MVKKCTRSWGLFIQNLRRQMKDTARIVNYMQSGIAEERPVSCPNAIRRKEMRKKMAKHPDCFWLDIKMITGRTS